jgi:hypothetical protein
VLDLDNVYATRSNQNEVDLVGLAATSYGMRYIRQNDEPSVAGLSHQPAREMLASPLLASVHERAERYVIHTHQEALGAAPRSNQSDL